MHIFWVSDSLLFKGSVFSVYYSTSTHKGSRMVLKFGEKQVSVKAAKFCVTSRSTIYRSASRPQRWAKTWKLHFYRFDTYTLWDHLLKIKVLPNLSSKSRVCTSLKGVEKQLNLNHFHNCSVQVRSRNPYLLVCSLWLCSPIWEIQLFCFQCIILIMLLLNSPCVLYPNNLIFS